MRVMVRRWPLKVDSDCATDVSCQPGLGYWELWERGGAEQRPWTGVAKERLPKRLRDQRQKLRAQVEAKRWKLDPPAALESGRLVIEGNGDAAAQHDGASAHYKVLIVGIVRTRIGNKERGGYCCQPG